MIRNCLCIRLIDGSVVDDVTVFNVVLVSAHTHSDGFSLFRFRIGATMFHCRFVLQVADSLNDLPVYFKLMH